MSEVVCSGEQLDSLVELVLNGPFLYEQVPDVPSGCNKLCKAGVDVLVSRGLAAMIVVKNKPTFVAATVAAMEHTPF